MNKRGWIFYVLVLVAVGLAVILVVTKINNKIIIASSQRVIENSLKKVNDVEIKDEFADKIDLSGVAGYEEVKLSANEKIDINSKLASAKIIHEILERREYVNNSYKLSFNSGKIDENDKIEILSNVYFKADDGIITISTEELNKKSQEIFGSSIDFSNSSYSISDDKVSVIEIITIKDFILKINKVYKTDAEGIYEVYIDSIYPSNESNIELYKDEKVIDYMNSEVLNTYKFTVKKIGENDYRILAVYCYDFSY